MKNPWNEVQWAPIHLEEIDFSWQWVTESPRPNLSTKVFKF